MDKYVSLVLPEEITSELENLKPKLPEGCLKIMERLSKFDELELLGSTYAIHFAGTAAI